MNFWSWLILGRPRPGIVRFADKWLAVHALIGLDLALYVPVQLSEAADSLLLPLAAALVGLSFAWGGNAFSLLASEEIQDMSEFHSGKFQEYLNVYQAAILSILVTLTFWGLAGLRLFDKVWPTDRHVTSYLFVSFLLYFFSSVTVRECWHVVVGAQYMLLARYNIRVSRKPKMPD